MTNQFPVPEGWYVFGWSAEFTYSDSGIECPIIEFSEEVGEDGLPLWERPKL